MPDRRRAVVVGVEGGIGNAIAAALAADGYAIGATWVRDEAEGTAIATAMIERGTEVHLARHDVADADAAADVIDELAARLGGIDVLVASAGILDSAPALELELAELRRVVDVNLIGSTAVALAGARLLAAQGTGGRIVFVGSAHEHVPLLGSLACTATKHALAGVVKSLALELGPHAITVNAVAPGPIATAMTGHAGADAHAISREDVALGRWGSADEVAAVVRFLASPEASYVTGSSYGVDGGMTLMATPPPKTR